MGVVKLDKEIATDTLNVLLKYQDDIQYTKSAIDDIMKEMPSKAMKIEHQQIRSTDTNKLLNNKGNWDF
jgi:hypothetical protein